MKEEAVLFITDRTREIIYNGEEQYAQQYKCGECDSLFFHEYVSPVNYCPVCGFKFKTTVDASA